MQHLCYPSSFKWVDLSSTCCQNDNLDKIEMKLYDNFGHYNCDIKIMVISITMVLLKCAENALIHKLK